jgi:hypothetical protein
MMAWVRETRSVDEEEARDMGGLPCGKEVVGGSGETARCLETAVCGYANQ